MRPALTARTVEGGQRTLIGVPSFSMPLPAHMAPIMPSYEERFLFLVLILLRQPGTRVVYVTSQPILPLLPEISTSMAIKVKCGVYLCSITWSTQLPITMRQCTR